MPNPRYKAIIFDLGETVLTSDYPFHTPSQIEEFINHFKIRFDSFMRGWDIAWPDFKYGRVSEEDFWGKLLKCANSEIFDISFAKRFYRENQRPIGKMFDLLSLLKGSYKLAALPNISKEWLEFKIDKFKLDNFFDVIVGSGNEGISKPDPEIYKLIVKKLSVDPHSCIFIDDAETNISPAKDLGLKQILFKGQHNLEQELRELEVI